MKKFLLVILIMFIGFTGYVIYDSQNTEGIPILNIEEEVINIDDIYIYGTHLNIHGNLVNDNDCDFVLYDGEFLDFDINKSDDSFNFSDKINDGLFLDDIPRGEYYLFLRCEDDMVDGKAEGEKEEVTYSYYAINNMTSYKETVYYTMSNFNNKIVINSEDSYPTMIMKVFENKDDSIYDIVIDPGHGGMDGGASKFNHNEAEITIQLANKLRKSLEDIGFKVKLTREDGQLSNTEKLKEYGPNGRAVIPREVNAKYLISLHMNSNNYSSVQGLEVYAAKNMNYDFAKNLVNNIVSLTGLSYSNNQINKVDNGIYSRNFTEDNIESSLNDYKKNDLIPYDITTKSNYYYIIRETGGIITGAYVDDRNDKIIGNPYVLSNVGTEAYLLELGYISNKNNLDNMVNNMDKYVLAISNSIKNLYVTN